MMKELALSRKKMADASFAKRSSPGWHCRYVLVQILPPVQARRGSFSGRFRSDRYIVSLICQG